MTHHHLYGSTTADKGLQFPFEYTDGLVQDCSDSNISNRVTEASIQLW